MLALHAEDRKWGAEAFPAQRRAACSAEESHFTEWHVGAVKWGVVYPGSWGSDVPPVPHAPHSCGRAGQPALLTNNKSTLSHESLLTKPTHADSVAARGPYRTPAELVVVNLLEREDQDRLN